MNERIKELMEEAGIYENQYTAEKFAELIVAECAEVGYNTHDDFQVKVNIQKHFGVEE